MVEWALANPALATYIFLKITGVQVLFLTITIICASASVVYFASEELILKKTIAVGLVSGFLALALPSQKEAAIILGVSATAELAKTDLAKQAFQILEKELERQSKK